MEIIVFILILVLAPFIIWIYLKISDNIKIKMEKELALEKSKELYNDTVANFEKLTKSMLEYKRLIEASNTWVNNKDLDELKEALKDEE